MILAWDWIRKEESDDASEIVCMHCGAPAQEHQHLSFWIMSKEITVGRIQVVGYADSCWFARYFEIWEDKAQQQRAQRILESTPRGAEPTPDPTRGDAYGYYGTIEYSILSLDDTLSWDTLLKHLDTERGPERLPCATDEDRARLVTTVSSPEVLRDLSSGQLKLLRKGSSEMIAAKYERTRKCKYGNINRGFTEEELERFMACVQSPKAQLAFQLQAYLGLRVGEVVRIRREHVDLSHRYLTLLTEKAATGDMLHLHNRVHALLEEWIARHSTQIDLAGGYLLWSDNIGRRGTHISPNWLRKEFRIAVTKAGLAHSYGVSVDDPREHRPRKLYRLTTHSLRHYFITKVYRATKDPVIAQKLARHLKLGTTQTYIFSSQHEIDAAISGAFKDT